MSDASKPGYRTSEFWLGLAAALLTTLFASGAIPTGSTAGKIAAIAATVLTTLGYTVARANVKAANVKAAGSDTLSATATVTTKE
jgi:hypothetical protein